MAFTFINAVGGEEHLVAPVAQVDATASLNIQAGDLLIAWCRYNGGSIPVFTVQKTSGSPANTLQFDAADQENGGGGQLSGAFGYVLAAAADATCTLRCTATGNPDRLAFIALQFRPDGGETVSRDTGNNGQGTSNIPASGNITTTGTDEVVLGGYGDFGNFNTSTEIIDAVAATEPAASPQDFTSVWYRILTATFTNGQAAAQVASAVDWVCGIIAFKSVTVGGGAPPSRSLLGVGT